MTEHKFTDEEVIRALECCSKDDCDNCPNTFGNCYSNLAGYALDLINRQRANLEEVITLNSKYEAEIERLEDKVKRLQESIRLMLNYDDGDERIKAEAIKEFADKVIGLIYEADDINTVSEWQILNLVKEMTEEKTKI